MPKFKVTISRVDIVAFDLDVVVEAASEDDAIEKATEIENASGWDDHWEDVDEYRSVDGMDIEYAVEPAADHRLATDYKIEEEDAVV